MEYWLVFFAVFRFQMRAVVAAKVLRDHFHRFHDEIVVAPEQAGDLRVLLIQSIGQFGAGDAGFLYPV